MTNLAAIKTKTASEKMEIDEFECNEEPLTPSFAVSPSFALLSAQTPRGATFDNAPATAESLPSDVLWRLATLLPVHDLPTMMAVCKGWSRGFGAAIDVLAPGSLASCFPSSSSSSSDAAAASASASDSASASFLPRRFPCLRSLDLSSVPAATATDAALVEPLRALTGLTHLSLRGCRALTAPALASVLSGLPRLRSLDLSGCVGLMGSSSSSSSSGGFSVALPEGSLASLTGFAADRIPWLGDHDVEALARALSGNRSSASAPSSSSSNSSSPHGLVELSLDGAGKLTGKGLAALSPSSSSSEPLLERLSLAGCPSLDDKGLSLGLAPFALSLQKLVLDRCPRVTGRGLSRASTPCFPALAHLSARDSGFDDAGADAAVSVFSEDENSSSSSSSSSRRRCRVPVLRELILDDCVALTDYGVGALAGRRRTDGERASAGAATTEGGAEGGEQPVVGLPSLARLSLSRLPQLRGPGLTPLLDSSRELTSLCLSGCVRLDDSAAQAIGGGTSEIRSLDVSDCERVGLGFCANLRAAPLVELKASRCPRLSPAAIAALGEGGTTAAARTLRELEASGCAALVAGNSAGGGGGVAAICGALPGLRALDLSATPLTLRALKEGLLLAAEGGGAAGSPLQLRLPQLESLNLACCRPRLSRPAVQRLFSSSSSSSGLRVNSWGCKEEEDEDEDEDDREEEEERAAAAAAAAAAARSRSEKPSISVIGPSPSSNSSSSSPALSFGHLSPQRGNRAAAAALAAAA